MGPGEEGPVYHITFLKTLMKLIRSFSFPTQLLPPFYLFIFFLSVASGFYLDFGWVSDRDFFFPSPLLILFWFWFGWLVGVVGWSGWGACALLRRGWESWDGIFCGFLGLGFKGGCLGVGMGAQGGVGCVIEKPFL